MRGILKFLKWVLIVVVVVHLGAFVAFWLYGIRAKGSSSAEHIAYLSSAKEVVTPEADEIRLFDEAFYQNQVFFLGESHGFEVPQQLDFKLLCLLNKKVGLTHYLAEVDYSQAYFLNEYLKTGNEDFLRQVFRFWSDNSAQWANQQFYDKVKSIREYNQSLSPSQQIKLLGVDRIQDTETVRAHMTHALAGADTSDAIANIKAYFAVEWEGVPGKAAVLAQEMQAQDSLYHTLLGDHYFSVRHTLNNIAYKVKKVRRDSVMLLNLQTLTPVKGLENEKLYGLWGMYHSLQSSVNGSLPLAALIRQSELPFKNKVVTLAALTIDSEMMVPTHIIPASFRPQEKYVATTLGNFDGPMVFVYGVGDLKEASQAYSTTLFKLDKEGSPYFGSDRLIKSASPLGGHLEPTAPQVQVTDYFQYIFLIRNSKALSPLEIQD